MRRLERDLNANQLTRRRWAREHGYIYRLGQARLFFLSGQPGANIVGATANLLLEVDEAQDILIDRYDKDIAPMVASANTTRIFWGTAWTPDTLLGRESRLAEVAQLQDGVQRVQYAAHPYVDRLREFQVQMSMAALGEAEENGYAERLMRTIKEEDVDLSEYQNFADARKQIGRFIEDVYNHKRIHSSLGYLTPAEFEAIWLSARPELGTP